jgi:hypothetical protein
MLAQSEGPEDLARHSYPSLDLISREIIGHTKSQIGMGGVDDTGWEKQNKTVTLIRPQI